MSVSSFPYKKEFLNSEELWTNARTLDLVKMTTIKEAPADNWRSLPQEMKWSFRGQVVVMIVPEDEYDKVDKLVDYFSEEARMQACRKGFPSPLQFYQQSYSAVVAKAQELSEQNPQKPFRHWLREAVYLLIPECTTFKIGVTKALLKFLGSKVVLDPSAGWGDRLLGAGAAGVDVYHGVDPNPNLRSSYDAMIQFMQAHGVGPKYPSQPMTAGGTPERPFSERYFVATEDFLKVEFGAGSYDTVFTSPPFFDYEIYVQDPKQSIVGRDTLNKWLTDFFYPYLHKAWQALVKGGYLAIYISDTKTGKYVRQMYQYITETLKGNYLGVIAVATPKLDHAYPIWIWRK